MTQPIRIGNQTSRSCAELLKPFEFALRNGFDAFEWFSDKQSDADGLGWDEMDMDPAARARTYDIGKVRGVQFSVHAPWQLNPRRPDGVALLIRSIDFARDIGAALVNLHLDMEGGARSFARALEPLLRRAAGAGLRVSIENTPPTTPADVNEAFARLSELKTVPPGTAGMCLDIGHANLCEATHNDYVGYIDALDPEVPIIHVHVHENFGDADSHLPLFTGPSRDNDAGVRAFLERLFRRNYRGALILEQWPDPPQLLAEAANRLRSLLASPAPAAVNA